MAQVSRNPRPLFVTALPTAPSDGMEVYFQSTTTGTGGGSTTMEGAGVVWHLRYREAGASGKKWEVIAAPRIGDSIGNGTIATGESTASTTYTALTTAGPVVTLPLAGDYEVTLGFTGYNGNTSAVSSMSYDIGVTGAVDADAVQVGQSNAAANAYAAATKTRLKTGLTAVTLTSKYKASAGTSAFWNRYLVVRPTRVG